MGFMFSRYPTWQTSHLLWGKSVGWNVKSNACVKLHVNIRRVHERTANTT